MSKGRRSFFQQLLIAVSGLCGLAFGVQPALAKLPGTVHCYNDVCHRIRTVAETEARIGVVEPAVASFYDSPDHDRFNPRTETSSGSMFDATAPDNAASPILPDGTILLVWSPQSGGAAVLRVNNAGPYHPGRTLDVSRAVAERLGFAHDGMMQLSTMVIAAPTERDAHYMRGRVYPKVQGYLGAYENLALASLAHPSARTALFQRNAILPPLALETTRNALLAPATELLEFAMFHLQMPDELQGDGADYEVVVVVPEDLPNATIDDEAGRAPSIVRLASATPALQAIAVQMRRGEDDDNATPQQARPRSRRPVRTAAELDASPDTAGFFTDAVRR